MRFLFALLALLTFSSDALAAPRFPKRMIEISEIDDAPLAAVLAKVDELVAAGDRTIMFRINSYGGGVAAGYDFIQSIEEHQKRGVKVICVVDTKAMSMGFAFLQGFCDERLMTKRSILLAHRASTGLKGNVDKIAEELQYMLALDNALAEVCAGRLKISIAEYKAKVAHGDWTLSWEEAKKVGAIDGTVNPRDLPPVLELPASTILPFGLFGLPF